MTAKEYLSQVGILSARLDVIDKAIKLLREEIESMTDAGVSSPWPDGLPHGTGASDPTASKAIRHADRLNEKREELRKQLIDYEYEQIARRSELWAKRIEIIETLGKLREPTLHKILTMRYIDGESFEAIAVEVGYSWRHVIRLHGIALLRVQKILENSEKN